MTRSNSIDDVDVCRIVNRWVANHRNEQHAASVAGISRQALNAQRNGLKPFSDRVLAAAGLRRVVTVHYEFVEQSHV
ncbi:hypothetical protein AA103196_3119 [Ameyamaea chiangmaiensis NBRC 103196]|uniref:Uncharacterized protein n=1 Tax=Ameyamaea chiangmaiensis TaxID=442969 RepID=A0A850PE79_9PROT|nr:hypothetical protein [Ameyamaea chiangmaiensis]MBS4074605.1 hypothetical protein [Ameyamaea chiangmaiensis]NVN39361.1 hypothetical protein [Ameyamaea chiangmaiensis]GBQ72640.1 hypothetical protein AA103196_3119 [Ameyamaea chiangmaiensis NBRC 103196]